MKIWDAASGASLRTLEGPDQGIIWLQWHPRGAVLVAGSEDFTVWMWNADNGQCMQAGFEHAMLRSPAHPFHDLHYSQMRDAICADAHRLLPRQLASPTS